MINKQGSYKTKLPTQYKSKKKKVLAREGDKHNYSIIKCVICNKQKMEKYDLIDQDNNKVTIRHCKNCGFTNASDIVFENKEPITMGLKWCKPAISELEDKS